MSTQFLDRTLDYARTVFSGKAVDVVDWSESGRYAVIMVDSIMWALTGTEDGGIYAKEI